MQLYKPSLVLALAILSIVITGSISSLVGTAIAQIGESEPVTVQTDKEFYEFDYPDPTIVIISGNVSSDILREGENIVIQVLNPMGARYRIDLVNVTASNGSYEYHMPIGGPIAGQSGEYKVLVSYRGTYQSETSFQYDAGGTVIDYFCMMRVCTYEVTVSNITHVIYYRMTGTITNVTADIQSKSLILDAETGRGGGLQIALPTELIVAETEQGNDDRFAILVDGNEASYDDIPRESGEHRIILRNVDNPEKYRIIFIAFEDEVNQIEIIGTWIAPEFNSTLVIAIVIVTSIAGAVVWSRLSYRQKNI